MFRYLVYKDGYLGLITPSKEEIDLKTLNNSNNYSHGIIPGVIGGIGQLGGGIISNIRNAVKESRSHANTTYAYTTLGKDLHEKHKDILELNSTW